MKILLIVPAYNEEGNIERVIQNLIENYPQYDYVVINDGSTDRTEEICLQNQYKIISLPFNMGLSAGFRAGMRYAKKNDYDVVVQYDADGQHDAAYIKNMLDSMEKKQYDLVIGSRFYTEKMPVTARMMGNRLINFCIKLTTGVTVKDSTSGMRMYNRRLIHTWASSVNLEPEPDTIAYLLRKGVRAGECQVTMQDRIAGESYLTWFKSMKYMLHVCISILLIQWFRGEEF